MIHIPTPCHENWDAMRPEEKGRFCAVCTKVVRDYTQVPAHVVAREVANAPAGSICGRVSQAQLQPKELPAQVWLRFPIGRVRRFLVALVVCFGPSLWGMDAALAQSLPKKAAQVPLRVKALSGTILDKYSFEPLQGVQVTVVRNGEVGGQALSDSSGKFTIPLKAEFVRKGAYNLVMTYLGLQRTTYEIPNDIAEIGIQIDAATVLPEIPIHAAVSREYEPGWTGVIKSDPLGSIHLMRPLDNSFKGYYYNPMDEWIWMRNSEVIHTGRW